VGFIQKLPTTLVVAFRATLEEITEADLLLHVVDATHPQAAAQAEAVEETLAELEIDTIPTIVALNKIDLADGRKLSVHYEGASGISALTGAGMQKLLERTDRELSSTWVRIDVVIPYQQGALAALFHEQGVVEQETHTGAGVRMLGKVPGRLAYRFQQPEQ
jgi:GTP-binding protein HflX